MQSQDPNTESQRVKSAVANLIRSGLSPIYSARVRGPGKLIRRSLRKGSYERGQSQLLVRRTILGQKYFPLAGTAPFSCPLFLSGFVLSHSKPLHFRDQSGRLDFQQGGGTVSAVNLPTASLQRLGHDR